MKKKNQASLIAAFMMVLFSLKGYSQTNCLDSAQGIDPVAEKAFNDYVKWFKVLGRHLNTDLKVIPTVIHIVYRNPAERLRMTRARINGQIDITNKHLRRLNANAINTRPQFLPVAADCNIQLALATRKPDRSRFDGALYHYYPNFQNRPNEFSAIMKATILDPKRYLNVWVLPGLTNGSAIGPWQGTDTSDGFFVGSAIFGTTGADLYYLLNEGCIFTHELGHYLGLWHTQSVNLGECNPALIHSDAIGDYCADTPLDGIGWFADYGEECDDGERPCAPPYEDQVIIAQTENYMFYNRDSCVNMFSKDQRARMRASLGSLRYRYKLSSFSNLLFTGVKWKDLRGNNSYSQVSELPDEIIDNDLTPGKSLSKNDISIFPNPAKSNVHLTYRNPAIKNMSIKVYNQTGVKLKELHSNAPIYELNLDKLPDGIYYINMTIDNVPVTKRIIKTGSGRLSSAQ